MVQTYQSPVRIYKYPFEIVMAAYEKRFPTCPQIPIFVGSEITYEYNSEDGAEWVIERKCQLNVDAPYLVKKIAGVDYVYFTQKNSLDRRKRTLLIEASNISFSSRIVVKENCNYYVHPENAEWTCFEQSASLDVKSFFGFEATVEKLAVKQYAANLAKGKEILEEFINDLLSSGVTYIPPFKDENDGESTSIADSAIDVCKGSADDEAVVVLRKDSKKDGLKPSVSQEDSESKLEAEYIRRFLGQLDPLEESRLCELKYGLQAHHKGKLPNDAHLLRFLRAREFDVAKAKEMVHNSIIWRKQHNVDKILEEWSPSSIMSQFFPGCWHHSDKEGRPLFLLRLGMLDMKGLVRSCGVENIVKLTLSICEQGLLKTAEATKQFGVPISTWTLIVDLESLSMRHLWRPGVQALLKIIEIAEAHYPETMGQVLIVRAPRVFPVLWTLISPFIHENTRKKFMINSSECVREDIKKYLDEKYIPDFLGGSCVANCGNGGHIPKTLYRPVEEHADESDVLSTVYTTTSISRGYPIEVAVPVASTGCVLTWDFDVLKGVCEFGVYHTHKIIQGVTQPHSPTINPVEMVTHAIANNPLPIISLDPSLAVGHDLTIEEKLVIFQEGDSMQGSHYCSLPGTYILQWRIPEVPAQHTSAFDFSIGGHKSKIMYYHEILDSANFRGSVASLESCRSSFSSIAPPNSLPSTPASISRNRIQ